MPMLELLGNLGTNDLLIPHPPSHATRILSHDNPSMQILCS